MLRRRIIAGALEPDETGLGCDVEDVSPSPLPHAGQYGSRHGRESEDIGLELSADLLVKTLFDGGLIAVACIVHEHVDGSEPLLGRGDRRGHLVRVRYIEGERQGVAPCDVLDAADVSCGHDHRPSSAQHRPCQLTAESR
jgi:hypothetical protein